MSKPILPPARRLAADDRDLERRVRTLETRNTGGTGDTAWTYPTVTTGVTVSTNNPVRYRKTGDGLVIIHGGFTVTTNITGALFTLPAGYRPMGYSGGAASERFQHQGFYSSGTATIGRVHITANDGIVYLEYSISPGEYADLGSLIFYADA